MTAFHFIQSARTRIKPIEGYGVNRLINLF